MKLSNLFTSLLVASSLAISGGAMAKTSDKEKAKTSKSSKSSKSSSKTSSSKKSSKSSSKDKSASKSSKSTSKKSTKSASKKSSKSKSSASASKKQYKNTTVNINKADAKALSTYLPGIGETRAKAIVSYRKKNGKFKSTEDLLKVEGVGETIYKGLKKNVSTSRGESSAPKS